jgi:DNA polymerase
MNKRELLKQLKKAEHRDCRLVKVSTQTVPGEGSPDAEIMFVGQCPGFYEDKEGRPFVGRAGQLLGELLSSINIAREDVYITNIVKHRPPDNRDPMADEVRSCAPFLEREIKIVRPRLIVPLGRFALEFFVSGVKISEAHGNLYRSKGRLIYPLYHPAAALRSTGVKEVLRSDFRKIPQALREELEVEEIIENEVPKNQMGLL